MRRNSLLVSTLALLFSIPCAQADGPLVDPPIARQAMFRLAPQTTLAEALALFNQQWPGTVVINTIESRQTYLVQLPTDVPPDTFEAIVAAWTWPAFDQPDPTKPLRWAEINYLAQAAEGRTGTIYVSVAPPMNINFDTQYINAKLGLNDAQAVSLGGQVAVAVLDTGIDADHPLFAGKLLPGANFVNESAGTDEVPDGLDNDNDGTPDEGFGHGTFVAGLIVRVAPGAKLLPVVVLNDEGGGDLFQIAKGLYYAIDRGVEVVHMSLGSTYDAIAVEEAALEARALGIPVIGAAGNVNAERREFPAADDDYAFGVAAIGPDDVKAPWSSYERRLFISAPGVSVGFSNGNFDPNLSIYSALPGGGFGVWEGTSIAAPLVSGTFALVRSQHPEWGSNVNTWNQLAAQLAASATDIYDVNQQFENDHELGVGGLNVIGAVQLGPPAPGPGDLNGDGAVNQADLGILLAEWGKVHSRADIDLDGVVSQSDLGIVLAYYGT